MNQISPEKRHHNQCSYNRYPTLKVMKGPYTVREIDFSQSYYDTPWNESSAREINAFIRIDFN